MATKKSTDDSSSTESFSVTSEPISILQDLLDLEEIDLNLYRGFSPQNPRWGRVYGGQTVSQALVAACCTVSPAYTVHSLHSYFLRPGSNDLPILYFVDRLRDGRSFCTRRVIALQSGRAIFVMSVSFHVPEEGFEHQDPFPAGIPSPDTLPSYMEIMKKYSLDQRLPKPVRKGLLRSSSFPFPLDIRRVGQRDLGNAEVLLAGSEPHQQAWMRATGRLSDSLVLHQCALAYLSDWSLIETATLPHGIHPYHSPHLHLASIDHAMWFHAPFRADEWLLYDMQSPRASGGRGLAFGKFYTPDGKLVVTTAQEGLIRISTPRPKSLSDPKDVSTKSKTTSSRTDMTTATLATRAPPPKAQYAATNPPSFPTPTPTQTPTQTQTQTQTSTSQNNHNNNASPTRPCPANRISSLYKFAPAWDPASIPTSTSTATATATATAPAPGVAASPTCSTSSTVNPPAVSSVPFSTSSACTDHHSKL